jgi:hypothetical protein
MIFFLKTQGKSRGYVERTEIGARPGDDVKVIVEYVHELMPKQVEGKGPAPHLGWRYVLKGK